MLKFRQFSIVYLYLLLLIVSNAAWAQMSAYTFVQSNTTYSAIIGGVVVDSGVIDDTSYPALPIGFTFNYNGIDYTTFSLNANGVIAMGATVLNTYFPISGYSSSNNVISAYGTDLIGLANGEIKYSTIGTAPYRTLVVQFSHWSHYGNTGDDFNFQIRLSETSNIIEVVYGSFLRNNIKKYMEIGLRGSSNTYYNNRRASNSWTFTIAGTTNNATVSSDSIHIPANGLVFSWVPPSCFAVNNISMVSLSANSAMISWGLFSNPPSNGYDWELVPAGNAQGVGVIAGGNTNDTSVIVTGLTPSTSYTLYVRCNCGSGQSAYVSDALFFCGIEVPGINQTNAIIATSPSFTYDFNGDRAVCYNGNFPYMLRQGIYFSFVAEACASSITVTTCNTSVAWDSYIVVFEADGTTLVGSADDNCGLLSSFTFTPVAGATYYALISPLGYSLADFRLEITQTMRPFNVMLTPIAATSSSTSITNGRVNSVATGGVAPYTYVWSNNATSANLVNVAAGTYTVSVTDTNGCLATATAVVGPPTDVVNVGGVNNFNMFPNPTAGNMIITFGLATAQNVELSLFNVNGQLVKYAESGAQSNIMFNLDLSSFTGGVYMARFTIGGETFTKQIVLVK